MKRNFTLLALLFALTFSFAGTPTMDGVFDGTGVWGAARSVSDLTPGWNGANAKRLYITFDASYIYLGAEITAASWQQFTFLINTKAGGGTADSWARKITYNHTNKPDYVFRGDLGRDRAIAGNDYGNYAEFHTWDGTQWAGLTTQIVNNGASYSVADNIPNTFNAADGFVEVRIARTAVTSASQAEVLDISSFDVQFLDDTCRFLRDCIRTWASVSCRRRKLQFISHVLRGRCCDCPCDSSIAWRTNRWYSVVYDLAPRFHASIGDGEDCRRDTHPCDSHSNRGVHSRCVTGYRACRTSWTSQSN